MYAELEKFLLVVWNDRERLMTGAKTDREAEEEWKRPGDDDNQSYMYTLEDRIYDLYAAGDPDTGDRTSYNAAVGSLQGDCLASGFAYDASQWPNYARFRNDNAKGHADYRIYLNPTLATGPALVRAILALSGNATGPVEGGADAQATTAPVHMVKIAANDEAYSGRPDLIVLYTSGGFTAAEGFARTLSEITGIEFRENVRPMTFKVANGVAVGGEIETARKHTDIGVSFGDVRCALIAKALFKTVTKKSYLHDEIKDDDPLFKRVGEGAWQSQLVPFNTPFGFGSWRLVVPVEPALAPSRNPGAQDSKFTKAVTKLFAKYNIDVDAPWN